MDFTELVDLASDRLGGSVVFANDDFFAPKENLLKPEPPIFIEGKYTERGKWMDGWESRRRRVPGHDWCIVRLGLPGVVHGVVVDTSHFKGNYPDQCSIEGCAIDGNVELDELTSEAVQWTELLPKSNLQGDSVNPFPVSSTSRVTHLRFNIFPDGGVARLRVYGEVKPDWNRLTRNSGTEIDLAAVEQGGLVLSCSDMFFGHRHNLIMPGRARDMSDGWETKRRRGPGYDWVIIKLGGKGTIKRIEIDTAHFKGNYPDTCSLEACDAGDAVVDETGTSVSWSDVLQRTKLQAHTRHFYENELRVSGPSTHLRFNIFPDGGVSRLRVYGTVDGL